MAKYIYHGAINWTKGTETIKPGDEIELSDMEHEHYKLSLKLEPVKPKDKIDELAASKPKDKIVKKK